MQLGGSKDCQNHALVEVSPTPIDAHRLTHERLATVAAHDVPGAQHATRRVGVRLLLGIRGPAVKRVILVARLDYGDLRAVALILDAQGGPAEQCCDRRQLLQTIAEHRLRSILGQSFVGLEVEVAYASAAPAETLASVEVGAAQGFIDGHATNRIPRRHDARGA